MRAKETTNGKLRRRRGRRLLAVLGAAVLALACGGVAVKFWIAPALVRAEASARVRQAWDGRLEIGHVEVDFFGAIVLRDVTLLDGGGRRWLRAQRVRLGLAGWPGLSPRLATVDAGEVEVTAHFRDGRLDAPLRPVAGKSGEGVDLRRLLVERLSVRLADEDGAAASWEDWSVQLEKEGGAYALSLRDDRAPAAAGPALVGSIDRTSLRASLRLRAEGLLDPALASGLLRVLRVPVEISSGRLAGELELAVNLRGPPELRPDGVLTLTDGAVRLPRGELAREVAAEVVFSSPGAATAELTRLTGLLCGGELAAIGKARLAEGPDGVRLRYEAQVLVKNARLPELLRAMEADGDARSGVLSGQGFVAGEGFDVENLRSRAAFVVRDLDAERHRAARKVLEAMRLELKEIAGGTDLEVRASTAGRQVRIEHARLANNLSALDVEPGGRIDLGKSEADFYVVGAPLKEVKDLAAALPLPLLSPTAALASRLTRLHVTGPLADPKVAREPLQNLRSGTLELLHFALTGGRLGVETLQALDGALQDLLRRPGAGKRPAEAPAPPP